MPNNQSLKLSKLKPTDVVKAVNSTNLGTVIGASQVYRHFEQGGFRIASNEDERCINLGKYCAWLFDQLEHSSSNATGMRSYAERREAARQALMDVTSENFRPSKIRCARKPVVSTSNFSVKPTSQKSTHLNGRKTIYERLPRSRSPSSRADFLLWP